MIQDIEPQRFNNQYSNRREPEDHDMVLSFSEKMIFAKVMDDENLLGFMTYGELQKITGCDRKIGDLVYHCGVVLFGCNHNQASDGLICCVVLDITTALILHLSDHLIMARKDLTP